MLLPKTNERLDHLGKSISSIYFEDDLFEKMIKFDFHGFTLPVAYDLIENREDFKLKLLGWCCNKIGINLDEFIDGIELLIDNPNDSVDIKKLYDTQTKRIHSILIEFIFELLPFGILIKISKMRGNKINEVLPNIREDIIRYLENDIIKINNLRNSLESMQTQLDNKEQLKKFKNLKNRQMNVSDKVIIENKFLIGLVQEIQQDKLEELISDIMDSKFMVTALG